MPQLHFSVDERIARHLAREAERRGLSLSSYIATRVRHAVPDIWPAGYLSSVVGSCAAHPLEVPDELPLDAVELEQ